MSNKRRFMNLIFNYVLLWEFANDDLLNKAIPLGSIFNIYKYTISYVLEKYHKANLKQLDDTNRSMTTETDFPLESRLMASCDMYCSEINCEENILTHIKINRLRNILVKYFKHKNNPQSEMYFK